VDYSAVLQRVTRDLRRAERAEQLAAIRGIKGFETIWERD